MHGRRSNLTVVLYCRWNVWLSRLIECITLTCNIIALYLWPGSIIVIIAKLLQMMMIRIRLWGYLPFKSHLLILTILCGGWLYGCLLQWWLLVVEQLLRWMWVVLVWEFALMVDGFGIGSLIVLVVIGLVDSLTCVCGIIDKAEFPLLFGLLWLYTIQLVLFVNLNLSFNQCLRILLQKRCRLYTTTFLTIS